MWHSGHTARHARPKTAKIILHSRKHLPSFQIRTRFRANTKSIEPATAKKGQAGDYHAGSKRHSRRDSGLAKASNSCKEIEIDTEFGTFGSHDDQFDREESALRGDLFSRPWLPTPSTALIAALKEGGHLAALPWSSNRMVTDLSHIEPQKLKSLSPKERKLLRERAKRELNDTQDLMSRAQSLPVRLPRILAAHIHGLNSLQNNISSGCMSFEEVSDCELLHIYDERSTEFLSAQGYAIEDVMVWCWIITAPTSELAVSRLLQAASGRANTNKDVPIFVFLFLLRRPAFGVRSIRYLVEYAWTRLGLHSHRRLKAFNTRERTVGPLDGRSQRLIVIRLIRHALDVWPSGLPIIASMACQGSVKEAVRRVLDHEPLAGLPLWRNRLLHLLSPPPAKDPYLSVPQQQRAQFQVLRRMTEYTPPLPVNREGYRAVLRVQLRHRKTPVERQWADYKAKTWPPWKEEKLGMDAERGNEGSTSRAMEVLTRMEAAGFSHEGFEQEASILAGWDLDDTPTIQVRRSLPGTRRSYNGPNPHLWAARIHATRTVREAWACFLECSTQPLTDRGPAYVAMFEKLLSPRHMTGESLAAPGDGKEVFEEPISPQEITYVPSEPPDAFTLFDKMLAERVVLTTNQLGSLLWDASFKLGLALFGTNKMHQRWFQALLPSDARFTPSQDSVAQVPDQLYASFIIFLCKFAFSPGLPIADAKQATILHRHANPSGRIDTRTLSRFPNISHYLELIQQRDSSKCISPLAYAFKLLEGRPRLRQFYIRTWCSVLEAVASSDYRLDGFYADAKERYEFVWSVLNEILTWMRKRNVPCHLNGFHVVCRFFDKALTKGYDIDLKCPLQAPPEIAVTVTSGSGDEEQGLHPTSGLTMIKRLFGEVVSGTDGTDIFNLSTSEEPSDSGTGSTSPDFLPIPFSIPSPATLHALVRVLGRSEDFQSLVSLLRWMRTHRAEIKEMSEQMTNGARMMRLCLTAVRYYMIDPRSLRSRDGDPAKVRDYPQAHAELLQEAFEIVESVEEWGGWPDCDEAATYVDTTPLPSEPSLRMQALAERDVEPRD